MDSHFATETARTDPKRKDHGSPSLDRMTSLPAVSLCAATTRSGEPCTSTARPGSTPPRCGRHPADPADRTGHQKEQAFLKAYALLGNVTDAAKLAGVRRQANYEWRSDAEYSAAFAQAREEAADRLEGEAVRRAVDGIERTVWYRGKPVGTEVVYSDVLLIFLLKGLRPEKFRDNGRENEPSKPLPIPPAWDPALVLADARRRGEAIRPDGAASRGQNMSS